MRDETKMTAAQFAAIRVGLGLDRQVWADWLGYDTASHVAHMEAERRRVRPPIALLGWCYASGREPLALPKNRAALLAGVRGEWGLTPLQWGALMGMSVTTANASSHVGRLETGERDAMPWHVQLALQYHQGWRPLIWPGELTRLDVAQRAAEQKAVARVLAFGTRKLADAA